MILGQDPCALKALEVMAFYQNLIAPGGDDQLAQKILSSAGTFQRTPGENGFDSRQLGADGFCGGYRLFRPDASG